MLQLLPFLLISSVGGGVIASVLYPFELMKVHLQMRNEFVRDRHHFRLVNRIRYFNDVVQIAQDMAKRENFRTIRVGMLPMFFLNAFNTVIRIASYQYAYQTSFLSTNRQDVLQPRAILFCGIMGSLSQVLMNPFSMMKTKLQYWSMCQSSATVTYMQNVTFFKVGKFLHGKLGWGIFTVGWGACAYRGFIASVVQMVTYQTMMQEVEAIDQMYVIMKQNEWDNARILAALSAGVTSTICVCPFDVVLTRLHTQPYMVNMRGLYYANFSDAIYKIVKHEGQYGFYKGAVFLFLKHGLLATSGMLFWDLWKDRLAYSILEKNPTAFMEQYYVEYIFDFMDLF